MEFLTRILVWLSAVADSLGRWLLAPIAIMPGWLSATAIAVATGVLLLVGFKYTSNQRAIKRVKSDIKAHMLALKLFKDSASVAVRAQGSILVGAFWLSVFAVVPVLVMILPVVLFLGQLALWYESRPLRVEEEAIVTMKLNGESGSHWPVVRLGPTEAMEITVGPVRVFNKREICWNVKARKSGYHRLVFQVDEQTFDKELAIGEGFMRVSSQQPEWLHPWDQPFPPDSPIQSVEIEYPERDALTSGTSFRLFGVSSWVFYWFAVSIVSALVFRGPLNVKI
jgi:hypothetical protein